MSRNNKANDSSIIQKIYKQYHDDLHKKRLKILILLSIFFISIFGLLDLVVYTEIVRDLIIARLITIVVLIAMFLIIGKNILIINIKLLSFAWNIILIFFINTLIFLTQEGFSSTYYAGLSLAILASAILLPWTVYETALICIVATSFYVIMVLANPYVAPQHNIIPLVNNLFFMVSTGFFCVLATYFNSKSQLKEFQLNYNLKKINQELMTAQSQLIQSEKINAMGNLSAGILHEINNPLNYTIAALRIVKVDDKISQDEDLKDTVNDIEEGMARIKNIVSDLHNFAHPEEADKKNRFIILNAVESALRFTAAESKDIKKIINVPKDFTVSASQTNIVQVLINLITNACKAIIKAGCSGIITINAVQKDQKIIIAVSDNGVGMTEETAQKVFDPFFTTSEVGKGMGMGLSVSYTIIKNHNGVLRVNSKLGEGSTFSFDLPV